jgi:hypothetical protein
MPRVLYPERSNNGNSNFFHGTSSGENRGTHGQSDNNDYIPERVKTSSVMVYRWPE